MLLQTYSLDRKSPANGNFSYHHRCGQLKKTILPLKMNRLLFAILIFFSLKSNWIFAQINDNQTLDSIYIKALNSRFDFLLSSGTKFIEPNEQTERIKNNFKNSVYAFFTSDELFDYAYKHGKTLRLCRITHKQISLDTIDINFSDLALTVKKGIFFKNGLHFKEANYSLGCGGTNGYIPDFRFAYDRILNTWKIIGGTYKLPD